MTKYFSYIVILKLIRIDVFLPILGCHGNGVEDCGPDGTRSVEALLEEQ